MLICWNIVGMVVGTAFCALLAALFFARPILREASRIRSLPRTLQGALAALALVATLNAQKMRGGGGEHPGPPPTVTQEEIARGYRLVAEVNESGHSFSMPSNAVYVGHLHEHGARSDFGMHMVDFGAWAFPCGTNGGLRSRFWWFMDGRLQDAPRNPGFTASAGLGDTLAEQGESRLWVVADGDERTVTWERFFADGDTNKAVNAQISLRGDGDFTVRSNDLVRVYRRINPDDWDDDGMPNDSDPNPYAYDGDNFGPHQELPDGANSNAYCWVDIVVQNANALVTFSGDGQSALSDPRFIARAGETNRVTILIGKAYQVTCQMPIACTGTSDSAVDVDQVAAGELSICWPVEIYSVGMRGGASFSMSVWPDCLGGDFVWTNSCCSLSSSGGVFTYSCNDSCHCTGCAARGYYGYEGYRIPAYGGSCGCPSNGEYDERPGEEDDGPYNAGASAVFSKSAVIFEDAYTNSPGDGVGRQSTQTELHCVAHGGPNGGHVRFEIAGEGKLERVSGHVLPVEQDVSPGKKLDFTITYKGRLPSTTAEDIVVTTTFTENISGATPSSSQTKLTSVRVLIVPACFVEDAPNRHYFGLRENFMIEITPLGLNAIVSRDSGWGLNTVIGVPVYTCPMSADENGITIYVGNATCVPQLSVVEPQGIVCTAGMSACSYGIIAMQLEPYIVPEHVSFSNIKMMEVPSTGGGPTGYFTNTIFEAYWHHTTNRGAGVWYRPSASNFFFDDVPSFDLYCPPPLTSGVINWVVPIGWGENDASSLEDIVGTMSTLYNQVYTLDEDGGLRIDKFGQWIKMDALGGITHSPGLSEQ